jgi:hypothetical protein
LYTYMSKIQFYELGATFSVESWFSGAVM